MLSLNVSNSNDKDLLIYRCAELLSKNGLIKTYKVTDTFVTAARLIGALNLAAIAPTVVFNLFLLLALVRTKSLHTNQNLILMVIVAINIGQGLISLPCHGILIILRGIRQFSCVADALVCYFGASLSLMSMLIVDILAYERYVAIFDPFGHELRLSRERIKNMIIAAVVFSLVNTLLFFVKTIKYIGIGIATLAIAVTYLYNVVVHVMILKVVRRLRQMEDSTRPANIDQSVEEKRERQRRERRTLKFTAYVIFFFLICYFPSFVKNVSYSGSMDNGDLMRSLSDTILLFHSTFSPLLYIWQAPQMGRAVRNFLHCKAEGQVTPISIQSAQKEQTNL